MPLSVVSPRFWERDCPSRTRCGGLTFMLVFRPPASAPRNHSTTDRGLIISGLQRWLRSVHCESIAGEAGVQITVFRSHTGRGTELTSRDGLSNIFPIKIL